MIDPLQKLFDRIHREENCRRPVPELVFLRFLRRTLPAERYKHVLGVARLARDLAQIHGEDPERARLAGLLHDTARCWSGRKLGDYVRRYRVKVPHSDFVRRHQPVIFHAYVGADLARRVFGVRDREVLSAIAKHTMADDRMTRLEKIVFLADHLAPDRDFTEAERLRKLAREDLDAAFVEALRNKMIYAVLKNHPIHPHSARVWNRHRNGT